MLKNKSKFNKVLSVLFKVCIIITALFTTLIFVLACIGSCNSKTATVKADNEIIYYKDGNYFTPMSNFYLSASGLTMIPNRDSTQAFIMGTDIIIYRVFNQSIGAYVPKLAVRCSFPLSSEWLHYYWHKNGSAGENSDSTISSDGVLYRLLDTVGIDLDGYSTFSSRYYYGVTNSYPSNFYSCIQYSGDTAFNNDVVRIKLSSSIVSVIDGYNAECIVNTITYYDRNNNSFTVNFYCANSWESSPVTSMLWEERSYYVDLQQGSYNQGYENGYSQGYLDGEANSNGGYNNGYDAGYDVGYDAGYDVGYGDGYQVGSDNKLTYGSFFANVLSIFDIPIFGFISLGDIFKFIFVLSMGIWALKLFAGG